MIALVAGFFLVAYLLGPGAIYRLAFSISTNSKRLQRTRTEEIVFSALITILPFACTWGLLFRSGLGKLPHHHPVTEKTAAYQRIALNLLGSDVSPKPGSQQDATLLMAYERAGEEQGRFVVLLWICCGIEGLVAGKFVSEYGDFKQGSWHKFVCDKFLLRQISEWDVLFTTKTLPRSDRWKRVEVDVLASGILYRGRLVNWFTDGDGKLAGIFLDNAERYQKERLARHREQGRRRPLARYWKLIPGAKLYLPTNVIQSYNIRYTKPIREDVVDQVFGGDFEIELVRDLEGSTAAQKDGDTL